MFFSHFSVDYSSSPIDVMCGDCLRVQYTSYGCLMVFSIVLFIRSGFSLVSELLCGVFSPLGLSVTYILFYEWKYLSVLLYLILYSRPVVLQLIVVVHYPYYTHYSWMLLGVLPYLVVLKTLCKP